ncbi:MAG: ABC transporter ATP-binding protein [Blastocatellia bacterium]|jgi:lipopolysaccharide transport system ATP-binding protein
MSSDIAIKVENLSKSYKIYRQPKDRLKQFVFPRLSWFFGRQMSDYYRDFYALRDISFEVKKGETVGIIGRNGSGKSTLLQVICGTITPTSGTVQINGRIAALLELGSGFNPEFSGRENVYLNGAVVGLSKEEIDDRFDSIVKFADIGDFIDNPVKTYSSGMMVRLAFAVQSQVDPDILIVDEALAVGDVKFQAKCFERLRELKENGTSILLVTHSSEQIVTHCTSAMLLENGVQLEKGMPRQVVNRYLDLMFGKEKNQLPDSLETKSENATDKIEEVVSSTLSSHEDLFASRPGYNQYEYRWGDGSATILDYHLYVNGDSYPSGIPVGQTVSLVASIRFNRTLVRPIFGITIKTKAGVTVSGTNSEIKNVVDFQSLGQSGTVVLMKTDFICRLAPGHYFVSLGIATKQGEDIVPHDRRYDAIFIEVLPNADFYGLADLGFQFSLPVASSVMASQYGNKG